ncbi:MAG: hypothetical protein ACXVIY_08040 [Mucilaginibacter sp.]
MKFYSIMALIVAAICLTTSCKKEKPTQAPAPTPVATKTLKFILYTDKDFSTDDHNISFALHISNPNNGIAFDSTVVAFKVKDIPHKANQLVFEKKVPLNGADLSAGFTYSIENVGYSWHLDTVAASEKLKVIEYRFE